MTSAIRRLPIPNVIKCEGSNLESSKSSSISQVYGYMYGGVEKTENFPKDDNLGNKNSELEYADISGK